MERRDAEMAAMLVASVLDRLTNLNTKTMYRKALSDFLDYWKRYDDRRFDQSLVEDHVRDLRDSGYTAATINQRLAAIRKLGSEAVAKGLSTVHVGTGIRQPKDVRSQTSAKRPLSTMEAEAVMNAPSASGAKGLRDRALLAVLIGCGLRRSELISLRAEDVREQAGDGFLTGVRDSRGRSRVVRLPAFAKKAVFAWTRQADLKTGPLFPAIDRCGVIAERAITVQGVQWLVSEYGKHASLEVTPEDLRRTCASLCREAGGDLDQIQVMLGHASIQTTQRLLDGCVKRPTAPNTGMRLRWHNRKLAS